MIRGVCKVTGPAASKPSTPTSANEWPDVFAFAPRVGDWVKSTSGNVVARVVGVTHCISNSVVTIGEPTIEVEVQP